MRIREIVFNNVRSFRGERRISFVDPNTDQVRPVTVLAGSNGSGKTTVFEAIEALLSYVCNPLQSNDFLREVLKSGLVHMALELEPDDVGEMRSSSSKKVLTIALGQDDLATHDLKKSLPAVWRLEQAKTLTQFDQDDLLAMQLRHHVQQQEHENVTQGGWLFFPHDRYLPRTRGGPIEPSKEPEQWLFHYSPSDQWPWQGSLEQLWVWQNYLDLEKRDKRNGERSGLPRFVESVEEALGENRRISVEEGRVRVTTPYTVDGEEAAVRLDQLPSGEQQVLLLFGELARRRRKGAVIAIDEIENSLHPTLQRLVMWNLNRLAREWDSQIIVTTHSLEVINTVRGGAFVSLDYPEDRFNLPLPEASANQP